MNLIVEKRYIFGGEIILGRERGQAFKKLNWAILPIQGLRSWLLSALPGLWFIFGLLRFFFSKKETSGKSYTGRCVICYLALGQSSMSDYWPDPNLFSWIFSRRCTEDLNVQMIPNSASPSRNFEQKQMESRKQRGTAGRKPVLVLTLQPMEELTRREASQPDATRKPQLIGPALCYLYRCEEMGE